MWIQLLQVQVGRHFMVLHHRDRLRPLLSLIKAALNTIFRDQKVQHWSKNIEKRTEDDWKMMKHVP